MIKLRTHCSAAVRVLLPLALLTVAAQAQNRKEVERILIETPKPYTNVVNTIIALGGQVTHEYTYANAIAAEVPQSAMQSLRLALPSGAGQEDHLVTRV